MSSTSHSASTSRNLVSVSGFGYRENLELQELNARVQLSAQAKNLLLDTLMLSQLGGQRLQTSLTV